MGANAIVIGSGVMGASIAYSLAKRGYAVTVLDKESGPAHGSTAATSAIIRFTYSLRDSIALAWESHHAWEDLREHLDAPDDEPVAEFVRTGMAAIDIPGLLPETIREDFTALGIPFSDWSAKDLERAVPGLDASNFHPPTRPDDPEFLAEVTERATALFTPDGGHIPDPVLATENFANAAKRRGATFLYGAEVVGLTRDAQNEMDEARAAASAERLPTEALPAERLPTGPLPAEPLPTERVPTEPLPTETRWIVELADGRRLTTQVVVNAAGPWSSRINALAGVGGDHGVSLRPLRQEVHTLPAESSVIRADGTPIPALLDAGVGTYLRAEVGGQLLIGGTEPDCDELEWIDDPDAAYPQVRTEQFEMQATRAAKRLGNVTIPNRARGVVGVYDVAADWTPIYDRSAAAGFYQAVGTSGNQFKNAPMVGEIMGTLIDAVEGGHDHDADPVRLPLHRTESELNIGTFSRLRKPATTSGNVLG